MSYLEEDYNGKRVAFLGGSFNPPHLGHLIIAESILKEYRLDEAVLLPLGNPPHKSNIADGEHRKKLCELLVEGTSGLKVSSIELEREGYTFTIETLSYLRENYDIAELYYVIGTDTLFSLETWYRFETLLGMAKFICVPRPGDDVNKAKLKVINLTHAYNCSISISRCVGPDISSTEIRDRLKKGKDISRLVPEKVERYLKENHIYD